MHIWNCQSHTANSKPDFKLFFYLKKNYGRKMGDEIYHIRKVQEIGFEKHENIFP